MEIKFKVILNIPEDIRKQAGITEDTLFQTSFVDGKVILEAIDEDEYTEDDLYGEDDDCDREDGCENCEFYCPHCGKCVLD